MGDHVRVEPQADELLRRRDLRATRLLLEGLVKLRREDLARGTEVGKFLVRQLRVVRDLVQSSWV